MKIGFEAKRFFTNYTGLGNYSRFVVGALSGHIPQNQYYLFTPREVMNGEVDYIVRRDNVGVVRPSGIYGLLRSVWRTWGLSFGSTVRELDLFHGLSQELPFSLPSKVKKVVTVHDLIFLRYPGFYHKVDVTIYDAKVRSACKRADKIVAVSKQTAADLIEFLQVSPSKIEVVYQGCHPNFMRTATDRERTDVRRRYKLPDQFILNVGTIEQRKNIKALVEAMAILPADLRIPVVIMGRSSAYKSELIASARNHKVLDKIIFLHDAAFADFPAIYQQARVFVYPSLFEGFGIPIVEAIQSRVPVITSQGSCFIEAAGEHAVYVDPAQPADLAEKLAHVLTDDSQRNEMVRGSLEYVKKFRPEEIANHLNQVYLQLCR